MTRAQLLRRNLTYYWRTNLCVVAGLAAAVSVLAGALLVGDSVRASLRDVVLLRLGEASYVLTSENFFREMLAPSLVLRFGLRGPFRSTAPVIALQGVVTHESSKRRAGGVLVYGVDTRFWEFHLRVPAPPLENGEALVSTSLAEEFGAKPGDTLLVRVQKPSAVPIDSLHSPKDALGSTLRLRMRAALGPEELGEFALQPQQGAVRVLFVPLEHLQRALGQPGKVNTILVADPISSKPPLADSEARRQKLAGLLREAFALEDLGVRVIPVAAGNQLSIESDGLLLNDALAGAARGATTELGGKASGVFTYLANSIRVGTREVPYSLVTALDGEAFASLPGAADAKTGNGRPPIWLNDWAWRDLAVKPGDTVQLDYYVWLDSGQLETHTAQFVLHGRVPMEGLGGDRQLAPTYSGMSDSPTLSDWNPPFPVDLKRIRPRDEDYWKRYRTAPKAFVTLADGQRLWQTRYGKLTAVRLHSPAAIPGEAALATARKALREKLDPVAAGIAVYAIRAEGTRASGGAVDFSLYFVSFSFFLVLSAVLLASLFFRLGIEQRLREIGLLEAVGYAPAEVHRLFLAEGMILAAAGSILGAAGAGAYGALMIHGLRTWWTGAVGTTFLRLDLNPVSLLAGVGGGIIAAAACIAWTLRGIKSLSPRSLVTGSRETVAASPGARRKTWAWGVAAALLAFALLVAAWLGKMDAAAGFFGAGALLLTASLIFEWAWLVSQKRQTFSTTGVARMGVRNASWRPGRSLLCIGMVAAATFILVAVDAFRRDAPTHILDPRSGTGGFPLLAESLLPIPYDLNTPAGREGMNLSASEMAALDNVEFFPFRLRPGEDASCLNLYQPRNPRILGVPDSLVESGRFSFSASAELGSRGTNPWRLLNFEFPDGAIPAIADINTMTYVLKRKLGEDFVIEQEGRPVRLRLVAALADSVFQSELLISEKNFLRAFPHQPGFRFFLIDPRAQGSASVAAALEEGLADSGFDVISAGERLEAFHRVENTYISTFQALGGLGLLLGTFGLAAVMLRNVMERRREMGLLRATGFRAADLATLVVAENAVLLFGGLLSGIVSAVVAVLPALASRGAPGGGSLGIILAGVVLVGLLAPVVAVAAAVRSPLLAALRSE